MFEKFFNTDKDKVEKEMKDENKEEKKSTVVITKDMLITEAIQKKPRILQPLMMVGLGCIGCPSSMMETIEQGALIHGIDPDVLVEKLNEY